MIMAPTLDALAGILTGIKTKKEMKDFLEGLLTPKEAKELAQRLEIVKMLKADLPQHEIARRLKVGVATVTRGSKELAKGKFKYV